MTVFGGEAEGAGVVEEMLEVEGDGRAGFLRHFVFDREVEIVGSITKSL